MESAGGGEGGERGLGEQKHWTEHLSSKQALQHREGGQGSFSERLRNLQVVGGEGREAERRKVEIERSGEKRTIEE